MEVTDVLILCAEVSVSPAGFAGRVETSRFRDGKAVKPSSDGLRVLISLHDTTRNSRGAHISTGAT